MLIIQSTTSMRDSGFHDYILPFFNKKYDANIKVITVGTGQAINNAKNCDGDILIVHSKKDEEKFVEDGYGSQRKGLMYNDFVIIGPSSDPLNLKNSETLRDIVTKIYNGSGKFISRGDDSGTHKAELKMWKRFNFNPDNFTKKEFYYETGQGMGSTLNITIGLDAYSFTDRATWINFKNKANHVILFEKDAFLRNEYGIVMINVNKCKDINFNLAKTFFNWMVSVEAKELINKYKIKGQQLFYTRN